MYVTIYREDEDEEAGITDPEGKPVKEKTEDTSKVSDQSESKENQVCKPVNRKSVKTIKINNLIIVQ